MENNNNKENLYKNLSEIADSIYMNGYQKGMDDCWHSLYEIFSIYPAGDMEKIFDDESINYVTIFENYTATEAIVKLNNYKLKIKEIRIGDEVQEGSSKFVIFKIDESDNIFGIDSNMNPYFALKENVTKTGRHFNQIESFTKEWKNNDVNK